MTFWEWLTTPPPPEPTFKEHWTAKIGMRIIAEEYTKVEWYRGPMDYGPQTFAAREVRKFTGKIVGVGNCTIQIHEDTTLRVAKEWWEIKRDVGAIRVIDVMEFPA